MFVPGRIIETPDSNGVARIAFISGHVVETDQGPRFVAPDLTDTHGGGQEFTVQSFGVTQEELELFDMLGPGNLDQISSEFANAEDSKLIFDKLGPHLDQVSYETVINAKVLRKLGEQGQRLTRNCPEFGIISDGPSGQKLVCCDFLDADFDATIQDIFSEMKQNSINKTNSVGIKDRMRSNVIMANADNNEIEMDAGQTDFVDFGQKLRSAVQVLSNVCRIIKAHGLENNLTKCVDTTPKLADQHKDVGKAIVGVLTQLLNDNQIEVTIGPKQILNVLKEHLLTSEIDEVSFPIMHNLLTDSKILNLLIRKSLVECKRISISKKLGLDLKTENPDERSKNEILFYLLDNSPELAEAFEALSDMGDGFLSEILSDFKSMIGATKEEILCVLRSRVVDRILKMDLGKLDPNKTILIPKILQNLKEANTKDSLMSTSDDRQDSDSSERYCSGNPILILKPDLEAVVPREATRDVLCGRTAFSVLDETGLRYFEPTKLRLECKESKVMQYTNGNSKYDSLMTTDDNNSLLTDERSSLSSDQLSHTPSQKDVSDNLKDETHINDRKLDSKTEQESKISKYCLNDSKINDQKAINITNDVSGKSALAPIQNNVNKLNSAIKSVVNSDMNHLDIFGYTPGFKKALKRNGDLLVSKHIYFLYLQLNNCHIINTI